MRFRALGIAALLVVTAGCSSGTDSSTGAASGEKALGPQTIDYVVSLNSAQSYYTLDVQFADERGQNDDDHALSTVWTKQLRTNEGVSYVSLVGSAQSNGQQPPAGLPIETPSVQCSIRVNGVEAVSTANPFAASCSVNLKDWRPPTAPVGSKVSESPAG